MSWTDERVAALRDLRARGFSAAEIAGRLGDVSRNAVIAKLDRLGLIGSGKPRQRARPRVAAVFGRLERQEPLPPAPAELAIDEREPTPLHVGLLDLRDHHCRWPTDARVDGLAAFCGHDRAPDSSYCDHHRVRSTARGQPGGRHATTQEISRAE